MYTFQAKLEDWCRHSCQYGSSFKKVEDWGWNSYQIFLRIGSIEFSETYLTCLRLHVRTVILHCSILNGRTQMSWPLVVQHPLAKDWRTCLAKDSKTICPQRDLVGVWFPDFPTACFTDGLATRQGEYLCFPIATQASVIIHVITLLVLKRAME